MRLYLDTNSWLLSTVPGGSNATIILPAKQGTDLELQIIPSSPLPPSASGSLVAKSKDDYEGGSVTWDLSWEALEDSDSSYLFRLSLRTIPLAALFVGSVKTRQLMAEITITHGEQVSKSQTFTISVAREVSTGEVGTPADLPDLKATQLEAEAGTDNQHWMTPLRTAQSIAALIGEQITSYATISALNSAISGLASVYTTTAAVASQIVGYGYQTASQVTTAITAYGYQTASQVSSAISALGLGTASTKSISDFSPATGISPSAITGTAVVTSDPRLSDARIAVAHTHVKGEVGLGNVDNTSDAAKPISTATQAALDGKQAAGSYATLIGGTVPASQLPSYVDDVLEYATLSAFPATGETGKIYVSTGTNKTYRWSGSAYVEIASSPGSTDSVTEGSTNLYFTAARAISALASTLSGYATNSALTAAISGLSSIYQTAAAVASQITAYGYQTASQVTTAITAYGYQTASQVSSAISSALANYATTSALNSAISGLSSVYTTTAAVASQITTALTSYATQAWVTAQSYATTSGVSASISSAIASLGLGTAATESAAAFAAAAHTHTLSDLTQSSATSGQVPSWNGTAWVPTTPSSGGGGSSYDQSLNTTDDVLFNSATATEGVISPVFFAGDFATGAQLRADATLLLRPSVKENWEVLRGVVGYDSATNNLWYQKAASGARKRIVDEDFLAWNNVSDKPNVALTDSANTFVYGQTITAPANTSALTASYSVTGANTTPLLDLSGTWNTTGVARGFLLDITDTASAAASKFFEVKSSGVSLFSINKGTTSSTGGFTFLAGSGGSFSFNSGSTSTVQFQRQGTTIFSARADSITTFNFGSTFAVGWNGDTYMYRDAANTLALRNGTAAQTFRLYNTYTDASNYERGFLRWNSNTLEIGTEAGGTGSARGVNLLVGSNAASFSASGSGVRANFRDAIVGYGLYGAGASPSNVLLKASGTSWMVRNGTDASFGSIQGKLTTDTAYTATMIIPTGYVTIYDSTGTAYKVACSL